MLVINLNVTADLEVTHITSFGYCWIGSKVLNILISLDHLSEIPLQAARISNTTFWILRRF